VLVSGNARLMHGRPAGRGPRAAGWTITALVALVSAVYLAQQVLFGG
jgi:hypothetical protein